MSLGLNGSDMCLSSGHVCLQDTIHTDPSLRSLLTREIDTGFLADSRPCTISSDKDFTIQRKVDEERKTGESDQGKSDDVIDTHALTSRFWPPKSIRAVIGYSWEGSSL